MHARSILALLGALLALAGCVGNTSDPSAEGYTIGGAFSTSATAQDIESVGALVESRGGEFVVIESEPPRFVGNGLTRGECLEVHRALTERPGIDHVNACKRSISVVDPGG